MNNERNDRLFKEKKLVVMGLFVALTYLANFIFNFKADFLSFEAKDAITTICAYAYGPVSGIIVAVLSAVLESLTASATGIYGFVMNVAGSVTFVGIAGLVYKFKEGLFGAVFGIVLSSALMTGVMIGLNVLITPYYMGAPRSAVIGLITPMLLPFNLVKSVFNGAIVLVLRRPLLRAMQAANVINRPLEDENKNVRLVVFVASILVAIAAIVYFVYVLGGRVSLFE